MRYIVVDLNISKKQYLLHYKGYIDNVQAYSLDGRKVRFPAKILQPMLLHDGIVGRFRIAFDNQGRFQSIERVQR